MCNKLSAKCGSSWTLRDYRIVIRIFWRWLKRNDNPKETSWIRTTMREKKIIPQEKVLSEEEVYNLIDHCLNDRDKAYLALTYEGICRANESIKLKLGDLVLDGKGIKFIVKKSKTGVDIPKRVMNKKAVELITRWLKKHPRRDDKSAWLFVMFKNPEKRYSYFAANKMFKAAAVRAGLGKWEHKEGTKKGDNEKTFVPTTEKVINLHWLRHAKITDMRYVKGIPDPVISLQAWGTETSKMFEVYSHGAFKNIDNALLKVYGVDKERALDSALSKMKVKDPELYKALLGFVKKEMKVS